MGVVVVTVTAILWKCVGGCCQLLKCWGCKRDYPILQCNRGLRFCSISHLALHDFRFSTWKRVNYCICWSNNNHNTAIQSAHTPQKHKGKYTQMASAIVRSGIRSALRGGASTPRVSPTSKRSFSASSHHDEAGNL